MITSKIIENQLFLSQEDTKLETKDKIDSFLKEVQVRAFRIAMISIKDKDESKDIVQDSMISLATKYSDRPPNELAPIFYRILFNRITDWHRKTIVRKRIVSFIGFSDSKADPIELAESENMDPMKLNESEEVSAIIQGSIDNLPSRQKQAFILRNFEGMSVRNVSKVMKCSEGSVKTHYFRAMQKLKIELEKYEGNK